MDFEPGLTLKGKKMNINSIGGASSTTSFQRTSQTLSEEQKTKLNEIVSKYDSSNISTEDAKSMMEELRSEGIGPGKETAAALTSAGFEMEKMRPEGAKGKPPEGMKGPPPGGKGGPKGPEKGQSESSSSGSIDAESLKTLKSILEQYDLSELSDDDQQSLMAQLENAGLIEPGMLLDTSA
jgi:hypothetical protein